MDKTTILQTVDNWLALKAESEKIKSSLEAEAKKITSYLHQHKISEVGGVKLINRDGGWYIPTKTLQDKYAEIWEAEKVKKSASEYITKK